MKSRRWREGGRAVQAEPVGKTLDNDHASTPTRFIYARRRLKGRKGFTKRRYMQLVEHGDPRYESAPFEMAVIYANGTG